MPSVKTIVVDYDLLALKRMPSVKTIVVDYDLLKYRLCHLKLQCTKSWAEH